MGKGHWSISNLKTGWLSEFGSTLQVSESSTDSYIVLLDREILVKAGADVWIKFTLYKENGCIYGSS